MTTPTREPRKLDGDKARRIVAAMRTSLGERGAAAATFDHVAQEAGVSRGLLHYYFGTKERLFVEVMRDDCEQRMAQLGEGLEAADTPDAVIAELVRCLMDFLAEDDEDGSYALIFEMFSLSRHHPEIRREMADLYRMIRGQVADVLRRKHAEGVLDLQADADAVSSVLFAMGDGMALQVLSDPDWHSAPSFAAGVTAARHLLGASG